MTTRNNFQMRLVSLFAFVVLSLTVAANAQTSLPTPTPISAPTSGLEVFLKSGAYSMRYSVDNEGKFSLGTLPEGTYKLTFGFSSNANAKSFYDTRSNSAKATTVEGVKEGTLGFVWDPRQNQLYEVKNLNLQLVYEISFEATGGKEVKGTVSAIAIGDKGVKVAPPSTN